MNSKVVAENQDLLNIVDSRTESLKKIFKKKNFHQMEFRILVEIRSRDQIKYHSLTQRNINNITVVKHE
jgi:hypothetical protein